MLVVVRGAAPVDVALCRDGSAVRRDGLACDQSLAALRAHAQDILYSSRE